MHKLRKRFTNGGFQMAATIKDVAKKANVSISTVSRVLSNQMHVSSSTYKRIQDAVAELNYIPNSSAVSLVKKSSTTVLYADSFTRDAPTRIPICSTLSPVHPMNYAKRIFSRLIGSGLFQRKSRRADHQRHTI